MTKRKFTPPTEFPAEYVTEGGQKAVILGRAPVGDYPLIGYVLHAEGGSDWPDCSSSEGFTEDGQYHIDCPSPDDLHDTLEVTAYVSQLEQAEARIEELEDTLSLRTNLHGEATYLIHKLEAKLAKAVAELERLGFDFESIVGRELKGQDDE